MGLKLKSTNGTGSVELNAPDNHNINTSFTLPTSNFTGGEWVLADGNGNVNIDSGTLYVDAVNDRVGVGTASPQTLLDLESDTPIIRFTDANATGTPECDVSGAGGNLTFAADLNNAKSDSTIKFQIDNSEVARFDSSGRWLVGHTSGSNLGSASAVESMNGSGNNIVGARYSATSAGGPDMWLGKSRSSTIGTLSLCQQGDVLGNYGWYAAKDGAWRNAGQIRMTVDSGFDNSDSYCPAYMQFYTSPGGSTPPGERLRIEGRGIVYGYSADAGYIQGLSNGAGTIFRFFSGRHSATGANGTGSESYRVWSNGNVQNTNNSYGSISDIKLKENIVDASSQWDDLKAIQVRKYNFKEETGNQTHTQLGVVAQEVELVSPGLVSETPDTDEAGNDLGTTTKSVNYSVLYMKAVKALQEAMERIEILETQNASFEARLAALEGGTTE